MAYRKVEDVTHADVAIHNGSMVINWGVRDCGFGQCVIQAKDGVMQMSTEMLSKEAIKAIVCKAIDDAVIVD